MADHSYYFKTLYPLQDQIFALLTSLETEFYLSGGTAASRRYLHHRFSDDLDFFVNDQPEFSLWAERFIQALLKNQKTWPTSGAFAARWGCRCRMRWTTRIAKQPGFLPQTWRASC